jgi:SAM-dependent methyltransferase
MLTRYWRNWKAKAQLFGPHNRRLCFFSARSLCFHECGPVNNDSRPRLQPYEGLAQVWHGVASSSQANYPAFIASLVERRKIEVRSILDLACGTGTMTIRLAQIAPEVVGLDSSKPMLTQAQARCAELPKVKIVHGDFRDFQLGRLFDVVVCATNSLNYVRDVAELEAVLRNVAEHVRPGGLFLFDAYTDAGMRLLSGSYLHFVTGGKRIAMHFKYDRKLRKEEAEVLMPAGIEIHHRIPIDPGDVAAAALHSGLALEDYFSNAILPGWLYTGPFSFYVMRRDGTCPWCIPSRRSTIANRPQKSPWHTTRHCCRVSCRSRRHASGPGRRSSGRATAANSGHTPQPTRPAAAPASSRRKPPAPNYRAWPKSSGTGRPSRDGPGGECWPDNRSPN